MYSSHKRATEASEVIRDKKGDNIIVLKGIKGKLEEEDQMERVWDARWVKERLGEGITIKAFEKSYRNLLLYTSHNHIHGNTNSNI